MTPVAAKVDSIVAVASETLTTELVGETSTLEVLELISEKTKTATKTANSTSDNNAAANRPERIAGQVRLIAKLAM